MFMNVTCPTCGQKCRVPESAGDSRCNAPPAPTLSVWLYGIAVLVCDSRASAAGSQTRTTPGGTVYQLSLSAPVPNRWNRRYLAREKVNCPDCGQRLRIPFSPLTPRAASQNSRQRFPTNRARHRRPHSKRSSVKSSGSRGEPTAAAAQREKLPGVRPGRDRPTAYPNVSRLRLASLFGNVLPRALSPRASVRACGLTFPPSKRSLLMPVNISCPTCGHTFRQVNKAAGQQNSALRV